jgi:hypothetical protein
MFLNVRCHNTKAEAFKSVLNVFGYVIFDCSKYSACRFYHYVQELRCNENLWNKLYYFQTLLITNKQKSSLRSSCLYVTLGHFWIYIKLLMATVGMFDNVLFDNSKLIMFD